MKHKIIKNQAKYKTIIKIMFFMLIALHFILNKNNPFIPQYIKFLGKLVTSCADRTTLLLIVDFPWQDREDMTTQYSILGNRNSSSKLTRLNI